MTLNYLINTLLKGVADAHLQVNDFGTGDLERYAQGSAIKYPLVWVVPGSVRRRSRAFSYSLSIVFADIVKPDESNIIDIQSDMISVAADFAAALVNANDDEIEVDDEFSLKPFSERFVDITAGVVMEIEVGVLSVLDPCDTPLK